MFLLKISTIMYRNLENGALFQELKRSSRSGESSYWVIYQFMLVVLVVLWSLSFIFFLFEC